jgi:hypothetical protein
MRIALAAFNTPPEQHELDLCVANLVALGANHLLILGTIQWTNVTRFTHNGSETNTIRQP